MSLGLPPESGNRAAGPVAASRQRPTGRTGGAGLTGATRWTSIAGGAAVWSVAVVLLCLTGSVVLRQAREKADSIACAGNLRALGAALALYSQDWDDRLPPSTSWASVIDDGKYLPGRQRRRRFHCPAAKSSFGYAMNIGVSGADSYQIPVPNVMVQLFETDSAAWNASGVASQVARSRHSNLNVLYCDGSVHAVNLYTRRRWRWFLSKAGSR
ncbi:MAG: hypothetical protein KGJ62_13975 [Armatimonadetes bacterium]|nr:hypothetical protein [Armatimonadota bacterium]MDE2206807.1 hypothetical protein [Armatimonadota bacterium]